MHPKFSIVGGLCLSQLFVYPCNALFPRCKTMPGDSAWPDSAAWDHFNGSVDGRLIHTVPVASPCHGLDYNVTACNFVRSQWHRPPFHEQYAASVMSPVFLNKSCDPFTPQEDRCTIGSYVQYSVDVATPDHVIKTLAFAKKHNIRFVVKNTGHDYMGKSTGAGALAIWMHHLNDREWIPLYNEPNYTGPAVKVHAEAIVDDLQLDAQSRGQVIVAGQCPSVGFAGGYIQGGGHSVLSSLYGMAADQALEFEVITTDGEFVRATASENEDLFWALAGGGGGTYGIVWSVTVKTYANMPVTTIHVIYQPQSSEKSALDIYWKGIASYLAEAPKYITSGAYCIDVLDNSQFQVICLFPKTTPEEVAALTRPWFDSLQALGIIPATSKTAQHSTVRDATLVVYEAFGGEILAGTDLYGARILPKRLWETQQSFSTLLDTFRGIVDDGYPVFSVAISPTKEVAGNPDDAVLPAFRTMHSMTIIALYWNDTASWDEQFEGTRVLTSLTARLVKLAPETGAYLNEANAFDPNWKEAFYGVNYDRLLKIKDKWDPDQILYGTTAVGGDRWVTVDGGRLCPQAV